MNHNRQPLVSVVIPTYNRIGTLPVSVSSVLRQTYDNLEVIIVDDGSDDGTEAYVRGLTDKRVKYVKSSQNNGPSAARNLGVRLAKGEYVAFQDSDDEWLSDKLEKQMHLFENTDIGLVYCEYKRYCGQTEMGVIPKTEIPYENKQGCIFKVLLLQALIGTPTMVVRRQDFINVGGFDENLKAYEDYEFTLRFSRDHVIGFVEEPLVKAYDSPDSVNKRYEDGLRTQTHIIREMIEPFREYGLLWEKLSAMQRAAEYLNYQDLFIEEMNQLADLFVTEQEKKNAAKILERVEQNKAKKSQVKRMMEQNPVDTKQRIIQAYLSIYEDDSTGTEIMNQALEQAWSYLTKCTKVFAIPAEMQGIYERLEKMQDPGTKMERLSLLTDVVQVIETMETLIKKQINGGSDSMYAMLTEMLNQGKYEDVLAALEQYDKSEYTETMEIIAVSALLALENYEAAAEHLKAGLRMNPENAEIYLLLGNYYEHYNKNQAYLCYENAEFFCDNEQDRLVIRDFKNTLAEDSNLNCRKTAIVILSYNSYEMTRYCIDSIRRNNLSYAYEIIVVDNASTDGSVEWLERQEDIKLIKNAENKGFPYGCNQGIKIADPEADIMLLNSDTIVFPNSLFWLRMGLYEDTRVGATGSITNHAPNGQAIAEKFDTIQEYEKFALKNNVWSNDPYELKSFLVGFAMLIRREVIDTVGLLDIRFSPGQFEDDDLGLRICLAGWRNILCHNSFIYHFGGGAGQNRPVWKKQFWVNKEKFKDKWSFDITKYTPVEREFINLMDSDRRVPVNILEIGCGLGATLARIQYEYPKAQTYGIEHVSEVANIGNKHLNIVCMNIEEQNIPFEDVKFDYIILSDVLECMYDPKETVRKLALRLKDGGCFLCKVFNFMNVSVFDSLLKGEFEYGTNEILDKSHLRFFTLNSINRLFTECGFQIEKLSYTTSGIEEKDYADILKNISNISGRADRDQFLAYQYVFRAVPKGGSENEKY